jgi:predicted permease
LASVTSDFRPAAQLFVTSTWLITINLKFALYLLLEPDKIWELVDPNFSAKPLPWPIITGNSLELTILEQVFSLSYTMLFAHYREQANSETRDHASRAQKQTLLLRVLYTVKTLTQLGYFS